MATATAKAVQRLHFNLPPLPYPEDALEPVISAETLGLHHGKHHKKYVDTMNELLASADVRGSSLEDIVRSSQGKLFNNAAQAWNHDFYWHSLTPKAGAPSAAMRRRLERDFGTYESFLDKFAAAANGQFGSGWAWLIDKDGKLQVVATANAETPMAQGVRCLLTLDVWEHAYYVDYRNQRDRYVKAVLEQRLNWEFAENNLNA
ncbi:MAG TPA: superoxide dismutase [Burkholderiales bacterium]|nr:superoxide dismutase [Burkholderiales bacterium]